eukprot:CAMPEP_0117636214 /NCGR_PEP_ID=MMETSP0802-20121206/6655_1 /TAXON_ID=38833 /ORGANISM="Micromonas sp., Strain CCMP2099" /LENGTH=360 /DNA_ID=CAMNT_0005441027 /DNA_START=14 /DNA_END=1093 /DNA_ORIENTATION=-
MKGADVVWIDTNEPCFAYHVVNCYDDPDDARKIVVDVCKSDGTNALGMAETVVLDGDSGRRSTANTVDGHGEPARRSTANTVVLDGDSGRRSTANTVVLDGDSGRRSTANTVDGHGEPASDASNPSLAGNRDATIRRDTGGAPKSRMKLANRQNAAGHGRDVSCLWRWVVCLESKTVTYVALLGPNTPTVWPEFQDFYAHKSREDDAFLLRARCASKRLCSTPSDFPCIDPRVVGLKHSVCYTAGYDLGTLPLKSQMDVPQFDRVYKHDLATGTHHTYELQKNYKCGDIKFVPDSQCQRGGGHLLVMTHDVSPWVEPEGGARSSDLSTDQNKRHSSKTPDQNSRAPCELLILADRRSGAG